MPCHIFLPILSLNINVPQERPEPDGLTKDTNLILLRQKGTTQETVI